MSDGAGSTRATFGATAARASRARTTARLFVALAAAACSLAGAAQAQSAPKPIVAKRTATGKPDISGVWEALSAAYWNLEDHAATFGPVAALGAQGAVPPGVGVVKGRIPYLPAALAQRDANYKNRLATDPEVKCFLPGVPRATYMPQPFQILETDTDIIIAYQYASGVRTIVMKEHGEAPVDSWMGWSNGHWDGDVLVVDVTGQIGQSWLDRAGNFATASLHVVERYIPQGPDHIWYEATLEDPAVYSAPWTISLPLYRHVEPNAQLLEFKCEEFAEEVLYGHLRKQGVAPPAH
ncbi:MAG TPA: hypothetical protein VMU03_06080 [Gammaproteobacteria bacterium]|nr:hypothetical protein [Gammaproteobacteria bacterium]